MKRFLAMLLAMLLCLSVIGCGAENNGGQEVPPVEPPSDSVEESGPAYTFTVETTADKYSDEEGTLMASYSYDIIRMVPGENASEEVLAMAETFNARMDELLEGCLETGNELDDWAAYDERIKEDGFHYTDEVTVSWREVGDLLSVSYNSYYYGGGAHPNTYFYSFLFDLQRGAFIDPAEIADDPEQFRGVVTDLILDEIEAMDEEVRIGLFEDYANAVAQWNSYCVSLSETELTVTFSAYELGPYAMGPQEFSIPYSDIAEALGEGGNAKLGLS